MTPLEIVRAILDKAFLNAKGEIADRALTGAEWRSNVEAHAEEVPALKLVLADVGDSWTNDDWYAAVDQVAKTLSGEEAED